MRRCHIRACDEIAGHSEPWKSLQKRIDFPMYISRKQAYVCVVNKETAGFMILTPEPVFARGGYLRAIGVVPEMRERGIGKKLLACGKNDSASFSELLSLRIVVQSPRAPFTEHSGMPVGTSPV